MNRPDPGPASPAGAPQLRAQMQRATMPQPPEPGSPVPGTSGTQGPEAGSALMVALVFMAIVVGAVLTHSTELAAHKQRMETRQRMQTLADTIAQSGLTDATAWFRRQPIQPVQDYSPVRDEDATPPLLETMDPDLGLVREFQVRGDLWGRYEVRTDEAMDISSQRGADGPGQVWDLGARGLLFKRRDPLQGFNQGPNKVVASTFMRSELRGIDLGLPAPASMILPEPSKLILRAGHTISGRGSPAFAFDANMRLVQPMPVTVGIATGTPLDTVVTDLDTSPEAMFGMRLDQLVKYVDVNLKDAPPSTYIRPLRDEVLFHNGMLFLQSNETLRGRGLLIVRGDLVVAPDNNTDMQGVIYVTGNAILRGPFKLQGSLVVAGGVQLASDGTTHPVTIQYDPDAIAGLRDALSRYRKAPPMPAVPGGREKPYMLTDDVANDAIEKYQAANERLEDTSIGATRRNP